MSSASFRSCTSPRLFAALLLIAGAPALAAARTLTAEVPATTLERLVLTGGDGRASIDVHDADVVTVTVEVVPRTRNLSDVGHRLKEWFFTSRYDSADELLQALTLKSETTVGTLTLDLDPGVRVRHERVEERWTVRLPARLALEVDLNAADVVVRGAAGGVRAEVIVGSLEVEVPAGSVDAEINVGEVTVRTASASVGSVVTRANVGGTELWVDKLRVDHADAPGPGSEVELHGPGRDTIRAVVNVGDAEVRVR